MSLIACCNGQQVLRNTCGTPANAKANAARLAGVPANAKANAARLAGVSANTKAFPARLAGVPANAKANAAKLAGVPANAKAFPVGLAELPRDKSTLAAYSARSKTFSRDKEPLPLTHVVYEITHFLLAIACKMRLKSHRQSEMRRKTRFACRRQVEMRFSGLIPYVCP